MSAPDRKEFSKLALGGTIAGTLGAAAFLASAPQSAAAVHIIQPGIKLCAQYAEAKA